MNPRLPIILVVFWVVAYVASIVDLAVQPLRGVLFNGVVSAEFALLGVALALADLNIFRRTCLALVGAFGLCCIFMLRPSFNGWELLLATIRLVVVGAALLTVRLRNFLVFTKNRRLASYEWRSFTLFQAFVFTSIVGTFLGLVRWLENDSGFPGEALVFVVVILVGVFAASPYALAVILLSMCMGTFGYSQTDSLRTALQWFSWSICEAVTIVLGILVFRYRGYHLAVCDS